MRSLRLRFFLISWPLVVAAIAAVAFTIDRYTLELERVEIGTREGKAEAPRPEWIEAIAAQWPAMTTEGDALLTRLAADAKPPVDLLLVGEDGTRLAATAPGIELAPGGGVHRRVERNGLVSEAVLTIPGEPVRDASGALLGRLFVLPVPKEPALPHPAAWGRRVRRSLWSAALVASLAAAAAAFLLAGPLSRRVHALRNASMAIASGSLDARVEAGGRDELADLGRSFNAMAEALQRAEAHKRNLVTDVAHELRTPLTNIIGLVESMQDGLRQPDAATLASLRDEAGRLATLIDELQELSLVESGQTVFQMQPVDAVAAVRTEIDAIRPSADGVTLRATGVAPATVLADPRRLSQVLRNLLRNAVAYTPAGGTVTAGISSTNGRVTIEVADTGRGIPAEHLPLIWERFHRVDPSRDRASGGMGIGLALVRQLVHGMNGEVDVDSEPGRGSRFRVHLPSA